MRQVHQEKARLHIYNNSRISQLGIYRETIEHKGTELPCSFFVVSGNGPALLVTLTVRK